MVAGPPGSGKTFLVRNMLKNYNVLMQSRNEKMRVIWAFEQRQSLYSENIENVDIAYIDSLPFENEIIEKRAELIVIDDLMN